jgi:outer membrane protein
MRLKGWLLGVALSLLSATAWPQTMQIGVVDQAAVFERTEEGRKIRAQLSTLRAAKQKEIEAKEEELSLLRQRFDAERLNMTEARRVEMERQVEQGLRDLQRMTEDADREMRTELNNMQEKFQREIFGIVEQLGQQEGFTVILERSVLFYHDNAIDITDRVIQKFNEATTAAPATP